MCAYKDELLTIITLTKHPHNLACEDQTAGTPHSQGPGRKPKNHLAELECFTVRRRRDQVQDKTLKQSLIHFIMQCNYLIKGIMGIS